MLKFMPEKAGRLIEAGPRASREDGAQATDPAAGVACACAALAAFLVVARIGVELVIRAADALFVYAGGVIVAP